MNPGNETRHVLSAVHQVELLQRLARLVSKRGVSLTLVAGCVIVDRTIPWHEMSFTPEAVIDEPCHLATALVILGAIVRFRGAPPDPKFGWSMLAFSVLIDVDHLPMEFGSSVLTAGTPRPYTHALWILALLILAAVIARYWSRHVKTQTSEITVSVIAGAACGIAAHFVRDVATGPISLWWPFTAAAVQEPYWWYVLELLVIVAMPQVRARKAVSHGADAPRTDVVV